MKNRRIQNATILEAINGKQIDMSQFDGQPYGVFTDYVRQHIDEKWGTGEVENTGPGHYTVTLTAVKTVTCSTTLKIEADTKEEAREKGLREAYRRQNELYWDDGVNEDITDIEVDEVEAVTEKEN